MQERVCSQIDVGETLRGTDVELEADLPGRRDDLFRLSVMREDNSSSEAATGVIYPISPTK